MMENEFTLFNLDDRIVRALSMLSYHKPTKIQQEVIPLVQNKNDVIAKAKTGTGKTAAFAIPICNAVTWEDNLPQALILEPTRELAVQVKDEVFQIGRFKKIKVPVVFGGFPFDKQAISLKQKSHIVVGTPGRTLDHIKNQTLCCQNVKYVVIDEADLMFDMGFLEDVKKIISYLPKVTVKLLFSATMPEQLYQVANEMLSNPVKIMPESETETVDSIRQMVCYVSQEEKYERFLSVLIKENPKNAIIFCATREMTEVLYYKLKKEKIWCGRLHGLMEQKERLHTIEDFRSRGFRYLIATDVAARGVDFEEITHVINYDMPNNKETYVHRIGRTGRNKKSGVAISFVVPGEEKILSQVEAYTHATITEFEDIVTNGEEWQQLREQFDATMKQKQQKIMKKGEVFNQDIMRLTICAGKKSKLRTCEVVATISNIQGINGQEDIGVIDIRDSITYVDILNQKGNLVLEQLPLLTMKGKCRKVKKTFR